MNRSLFYSLLLMLVLVGSTWGCKPVDDDLKKKVVYNGPIAETRNIVSQFSDSAKLQIKLMAPLQLQYESGDAIYPDSLFITFYDKDGKVNNTLRANYGKYEKQKDIYFVRGNVVVHNPIKDETMRTEELFWDKQTRRIYTEKFVTIKTQNDILKGQGLETNQEFYPMRIKKPTGIISVQEQLSSPPTPPTK